LPEVGDLLSEYKFTLTKELAFLGVSSKNLLMGSDLQLAFPTLLSRSRFSGSGGWKSNSRRGRSLESDFLVLWIF